MISVAKILEIGPYPPPLAGWAIRIQFVRHELQQMGHDCRVLNIGKNRHTPSNEYIPVYSGLDYAVKVIRYAARGYTFHLHVNGDDIVGLMLVLYAALVGWLMRHCAVLSFHAGIDQVYFPRNKSRSMAPLFTLLFKLCQHVVCDNAAVKEKIEAYRVPATKVTAIQTFGSSYVSESDATLPAPLTAFLARHERVIVTYILLKPGFHVETFLRAVPEILAAAPGTGIVVVGSRADSEPALRAAAETALSVEGVCEHAIFTDDLAHDQFLKLVEASSLMLRTPTTDGECASVLEALSLGTPVVAADNGTRPASVITFVADDDIDMCRTTCQVLTELDYYRARVVRPELHDTVRDESELLVRSALPLREAPRTIPAPNHIAESCESLQEQPVETAASR